MKATPRASTMPSATHNKVAPAPVQEEGMAAVAVDVGAEGGDVPSGVGGDVSMGDVETVPRGKVPRNHSAPATMSTAASASANHRRRRCHWVIMQL